MTTITEIEARGAKAEREAIVQHIREAAALWRDFSGHLSVGNPAQVLDAEANEIEAGAHHKQEAKNGD